MDTILFLIVILVSILSTFFQLIVKAVPIKEGHKLRFFWPVIPSIRYYKEGPCSYLSHLIGHEGNGSLFFALKKLGQSNIVYAYVYTYFIPWLTLK